MFVCMNTGVALLKLFQVIEIFGLFYFIPMDFGDILDHYLKTMNELADLVSLNEDTFMTAPEYDQSR